MFSTVTVASLHLDEPHCYTVENTSTLLYTALNDLIFHSTAKSDIVFSVFASINSIASTNIWSIQSRSLLRYLHREIY